MRPALAAAVLAAATPALQAAEPLRLHAGRGLSECLAPALPALSAHLGVEVTLSDERVAAVLVDEEDALTRLLEKDGTSARALGYHRRGKGLVMVTAALARADSAAARGLLDFLASREARPLLAGCALQAEARAFAKGAAAYASAVADWWLPACSLAGNLFNEPSVALGPPDAIRFGGDFYAGIMSLGQGGYAVLELSVPAVDGPGPDVRVYQAVSSEPVTVYAAASAAGPFRLLGLREPCGERTPGLLSNHCDFDLAASGLAEARFLKVEDGEIYPCLAAGTRTEGADLDAVEVLHSR